jgi:hypothetical protein
MCRKQVKKCKLEIMSSIMLLAELHECYKRTFIFRLYYHNN